MNLNDLTEAWARLRYDWSQVFPLVGYDLGICKVSPRYIHRQCRQTNTTLLLIKYELYTAAYSDSFSCSILIMLPSLRNRIHRIDGVYREPRDSQLLSGSRSYA